VVALEALRVDPVDRGLGATKREIWDQHRGIVDACTEEGAGLAAQRLVEHYGRVSAIAPGSESTLDS
jgi:DNA-binding GntR family transcriptional regulator